MKPIVALICLGLQLMGSIGKSVVVAEELEGRALPSGYYVSPTGNDSSPGTRSAPFRTLQRAADVAVAGDTVHVLAGTYAQGMNLYNKKGGTAEKPIRFLAERGATITHCATARANASLAAINIERAGDWYVIEGFRIVSDGSMQRAGIRIAGSNHTRIIKNSVQRAYMGIFASNCDGLVIQGNVCSDSTDEHGIYLSADRNYIVRHNTLYANNWDGLHLNVMDGVPGSTNFGGLIEGNIIYGNHLSGMDIQGVTDSIFRNNVIYRNEKHGVTLHNLDQKGCPPVTGNTFVNNTIVGNDRFAVQMAAGGNTANTFFNNILCGGSGNYGSIGINGRPKGLVSDYNAVVDSFSMNLGAGKITLAQWRGQCGQDRHSRLVSPKTLFIDASANDYRLKPSSRAIGAGVASFAGKSAPTTDIQGTERPKDVGFDIGAYAAPGRIRDGGRGQ